MLGDEILKQRLGLHLSMAELSRLTGVDDFTISRLERKKTKFILEKDFKKLNKVLNLSGYEEYCYKTEGTLFGEMLKSYRLMKGYSQKELASLCGYRNKSSIANFERGTYSKISNSAFRKLQEFLDLNEEEFMPFILKSEEIKGSIKIQNKDLIQRLVIEKRKELRLSKSEVARRASVSDNTITKIETNIDDNMVPSKLLKIMHVLGFSKEEILDCFTNLEERDLEQYEQDGLQK